MKQTDYGSVDALHSDGWVAWAGSFNDSRKALANSKTAFVMMRRHGGNDTKEAMLLGTRQALLMRSRELANAVVYIKESLACDVKEYVADDGLIREIVDRGLDSVIESQRTTGLDEDIDSPALRELTEITAEAVMVGASDIHMIPRDNSGTVALRVDGLFPPRYMRNMSLDRMQRLIRAGLGARSVDQFGNIDDKEVADNSIDIRVTLKTEKGEEQEGVRLRSARGQAADGMHAVMRVIRTAQRASKKLDDLGIEPDNLAAIRKAVSGGQGIVLVTGPTGSGKTTTLAAIYMEMDDNRKVILIEDPIEIKISKPRVVQMPVIKGSNVGYSDYVELALRQDPDVVGIGEVRNSAVASQMVRSARTGHLMVSTLHCTDAIGALPRLVQEGIPPAVLAEDKLLLAVTAQRQIPMLCHHCKIEHSHPVLGAVFIAKKEGCEYCDGLGFIGRKLVTEVLLFDRTDRKHIATSDWESLRDSIRSKGWTSMADRAIELIRAGIFDPNTTAQYVPNLFDDGLETDYKGLGQSA